MLLIYTFFYFQDARNHFQLLQATTARPFNFLQNYKNLDTISSRECFSVGVLYLGKGQSKTDVWDNTDGSAAYQELLKGLGWEVEVCAQHAHSPAREHSLLHVHPVKRSQCSNERRCDYLALPHKAQRTKSAVSNCLRVLTQVLSHTGHLAGMDAAQTGDTSLYWASFCHELMFHVGTLMPSNEHKVHAART